jgi:hypothetical protein
MELGQLLTHSGLTHQEVASVVCPGSFCFWCSFSYYFYSSYSDITFVMTQQDLRDATQNFQEFARNNMNTYFKS